MQVIKEKMVKFYNYMDVVLKLKEMIKRCKKKDAIIKALEEQLMIIKG